MSHDESANISMESIQIVEITDSYNDSEDNNANANGNGEVSMEDSVEQQHPESVITFPPETESARRTELAALTKDQLIEIILEREREIRKRGRIINRLRQSGKMPTTARQGSTSSSVEMESEPAPPASHGDAKGKEKKRKTSGGGRDLDFAAYGKRHVALKFLYLGWDYQGFVVQDETDNTIEDHIFRALAKTKLIESRETSHYHRCGRTDKSVSAFSQVISLHVRSTQTAGPGLITPASPAKAGPIEIAYLQMLNGVLPKNIRMLAWSAVQADFSARFSCRGRRYRYYFPRANLHLGRMNEAAQLLLGEHDFRNFCKADIANGVTNYMRRIDNIFVEELNGSISQSRTDFLQSESATPQINRSSTDGYSQMCVLHVYGSAFLWHQVRSIVALLYLIGQGKEEPSMIMELLDIEKCPAKPQYLMAEGFPLVLFDCIFEDPAWQTDEANLRMSVRDMECIWTEHTVRAAIIGDMVRSMKDRLWEVSQQETDPGNLLQALFPERKGRYYQPLRDRKTCDTIESRLQKKLKVSA
ncbi:tRNA pseudouridine(38/39) synthase [Hypsibius exemplaris]|uniref:tRNA pseudouridine(38/39) synthase n=1 Tax=Hypsibius exemplaris TaxID=2072580 RepID=A0A9X6NAY7_HYPEX|nr:tRNA pseudouridine(38/39) synthase [Hypsibius exemplaris]